MASARNSVRNRRRSGGSPASRRNSRHAAYVDGCEGRGLGCHTAQWKACRDQCAVAWGAFADGGVGRIRRVSLPSRSSEAEFSQKVLERGARLPLRCPYGRRTGGKFRPNQLFGASLLDPEQQRMVVRAVEKELLTPVGLRTLERSDPDYKGRYQGSLYERDAAYHQGTAWPWLMGPFIDAYLLAFGQTDKNLSFCKSLIDRLEAFNGLDWIPEIYDGDEPHRSGGCPAQAWSVAEVSRVRSTWDL